MARSFLQFEPVSSIGLRELLSRAKTAPIAFGGPSSHSFGTISGLTKRGGGTLESPPQKSEFLIIIINGNSE